MSVSRTFRAHSALRLFECTELLGVGTSCLSGGGRPARAALSRGWRGVPHPEGVPVSRVVCVPPKALPAVFGGSVFVYLCCTRETSNNWSLKKTLKCEGGFTGF